MRALLSGLIGAAASSAVWLAAEHFQQTNYGWMVCLVGIVTGLCVNRASAKGSAGFARGALAIILTLAGIAGGQRAYAMIMQAASTGKAAAVVKAVEPEASEEGEAEPEADAAASVTPERTPPEDVGTLTQRNYTKTAMKKNFSDWDMIWMCVAALAAYVTGKGGGGDVVAESTEEGSAEPQDMPENEAE